MASIMWSDVTGGATGSGRAYAALGEDEQIGILAWVNDALKVGLFGGEDSPKVYLLRVYLARHLAELAVRGGRGTSGDITSKSIGTSSISISYAQEAAGASALESTNWGRQYRQMIRNSPARVWRQP